MTSNFPRQNQHIKTLALEVISLLSRNKECVTEISACEILGTFLRTLKDDDFQKQRVLDTLSGLTNAPQLVKEAHTKGELSDGADGAFTCGDEFFSLTVRHSVLPDIRF